MESGFVSRLRSFFTYLLSLPQTWTHPACLHDRERESKLQNFSGFERFMLLKVDTGGEGGEEGGAAAKLGYTEFVSHTTWKHKLDFEDWRQRCVGSY